MSQLTANLKDCAAVAFVALLLFGPFLGLQLGDNNAGNLTLSTRPELLAIAVGLTFAERFLLLLWHERRSRRKPNMRVAAAVAKSGKFVGPVPSSHPAGPSIHRPMADFLSRSALGLPWLGGANITTRPRLVMVWSARYCRTMIPPKEWVTKWMRGEPAWVCAATALPR